MKRYILYPVACLLSLTLFFSCRRTVYCTVPGTFIAFRNAGSITDAAMDLYVYQTDGKFAQPVDSFKAIHMIDTNYGNNPVTTYFKSSYWLTTVESKPYQFDWKVILKPSGTTYNITIRHDDRSVKSNSKGNYYCSDNVFYSVNGVQSVVAGLQNDEGPPFLAYVVLGN